MQFVLLNVQMFLVSMRTEDGACSVYENAARNSHIRCMVILFDQSIKNNKNNKRQKIERKKSKKSLPATLFQIGSNSAHVCKKRLLYFTKIKSQLNKCNRCGMG